MDSASDDKQPNGFYVEEGCCLACRVPESIAPELFGWRGNQCFIRRQPRREEMPQMLEAIDSSELDCIRYGGSDSAVLRRIGEAGLAVYADSPEVRAFPPIQRNLVIFSASGSNSIKSPAGAATRFRTYLQTERDIRFRQSLFGPHIVKYSWYRNCFHKVTFREILDENCYSATLQPYPSWILRTIARQVGEWLASEPDVSGVQWHVAGSRPGEVPPSDVPY